MLLLTFQKLLFASFMVPSWELVLSDVNNTSARSSKKRLSDRFLYPFVPVRND